MNKDKAYEVVVACKHLPEGACIQCVRDAITITDIPALICDECEQAKGNTVEFAIGGNLGNFLCGDCVGVLVRDTKTKVEELADQRDEARAERDDYARIIEVWHRRSDTKSDRIAELEKFLRGDIREYVAGSRRIPGMRLLDAIDTDLSPAPAQPTATSFADPSSKLVVGHGFGWSSICDSPRDFPCACGATHTEAAPAQPATYCAACARSEHGPCPKHPDTVETATAAKDRIFTDNYRGVDLHDPCRFDPLGAASTYATVADVEAALATPPSPAANVATKCDCGHDRLRHLAGVTGLVGTGMCNLLECKCEGFVSVPESVNSSNRDPVANRPQYRVWECKIVVPADVAFPAGFDYPPRRAAIETVEQAGVPVITCFSGWGGKLTEAEARSVDADAARSKEGK